MNSYLKKILDDIRKLDEAVGLDKTLYDRNTANLMYLVNALVGEAGEVADATKKFIKYYNGDSKVAKEYIDKIVEELVDIEVYVAELINMLGVDFDKYWDNKLKVLYERTKNGRIVFFNPAHIRSF